VTAFATDGEDPSDAAEEKAELVRRAMNEFEPDPATDEGGFEDFLYDLTDALILGVNVQELIWHRSASDVLPRAACWVHPRQFGMDETGRLGLMLNGARDTLYGQRSAIVTPFLPEKFVIGVYKTRSGTRTMGGLLRPLAWWWCAVMYGRDWVLRNAELFGQPIRDIEYDPGIKPEDLAKLQEMAAQMGSSAWITRPAGTKMTLVEPQKTGNAAPQAELLDRANTAADLVVLWQTLTSEVGDSGSRALGSVHAGVRRERVQNIATWVGNVLSYQFAPMVCRLNYGNDDECPVIKPDFTEQESAKDKTTRLKEAATIVPMPKTWAYDQLGVPVPQDGEETISMGAQAPKDETTNDTKHTKNDRMMDQDELRKMERQAMQARETFATEFVDEGLLTKAQRALAVAQANDLAPVRARLRAILALADVESQRAALKDLRAELPDILRVINAAPSAARALEEAMGAALINGMDDVREERKES
jgi:phage gp29-like protein